MKPATFTYRIAGVLIETNFRLFKDTEKTSHRVNLKLMVKKNVRQRRPKLLSSSSKAANHFEIIMPSRANEAQISDFITYRALPQILSAQNLWALHASSVIIHGRAHIFVGLSGAGKSTLAYSLKQNGHISFSDEAIILKVGRKQIWAMSYPQSLRIRKNLIELGLCKEQHKYNRQTKKYHFQIDSHAHYSKKWPVAYIYLLDSMRAGIIGQSTILKTILKSSYTPLDANPKHGRLILDSYSKLQSLNKIICLKYRKNPTNLNALIRSIENSK